MANMTKEEAYRAGYENPLIGDISPLQRLYGTIGAIGEELGGGDMGTPFGQRFASRQKATKAEIKRLQELRAKFPEEFGQGMMKSSDVQDPYLFGQVLPGIAAMRPGVTTFSQIVGPQRLRQGPGVAAEAEAPRAVPGIGYAPRPAEPYYRNVPPEMGTSPGPMNAFNQNMYGMSTGRYGPAGAQYAPEMAVTDFESYGPMGARPTPGPYAPSGFDRNMLAAYRQGRYNRMAGGRPGPMGGDFTLEELGSAPVPYRQGGLVYEPVSGGQGAAPGMLPPPSRGGNLPMMAQGRGMRPTLMEGEFTEVPQQGQIPYGMGYRPNFTMQGGTYAPSAGAPGMSMGQRMAQGAYPYVPTAPRAGLPWGTVAGVGAAGAALPIMAEYGSTFDRPVSALPSSPLAGSSAPPAAVLQSPVMPSDFSSASPDNIMYGFGQAAGYGGAQGGGERMGMLGNLPAAPKAARKSKGEARGPATQNAPLPPRRPDEYGFEGNLNYKITQMLDRLTGQDEANRGYNTQQYYATNPYPY